MLKNNDYIKITYFTTFFAFSLLLNLNGISEAVVIKNEKKFPLPIAEIEAAVSAWLKSEGLAIHLTRDDMGRVNYNAVRKGVSLNILIEPNSPLASRVVVSTKGELPTDRALLEQLWRYVANEDIYYSKAQIQNHQQKIPTQVLTWRDAVVCIHIKVNDNDYQVSGFIIDQDGLIICTAHNMDKINEDLTVVFQDGRSTEGRLIRIDLTSDLALIQIKPTTDVFVHISEKREIVSIGETVYSVGCPNNFGGTINRGIVNSLPRMAEDQLLWQVSLEIHPGSSGSPVFDDKGHFIGIIKGRFRGTETIGFLIPFETVIRFLDESY